MKRGMGQRYWLGIWLGWAVAAAANQIQVSQLTLLSISPGSHMQVKFDLAWDNSWRCDQLGEGRSAPGNWDAAWVFLKYRVSPGNNVYVGFMVWSNFTATKCRGLVSLNQVIKEIICLQPLK